MGMGGFVLQTDGAPVFPLIFDLYPEGAFTNEPGRILPEQFEFENYYATEIET